MAWMFQVTCMTTTTSCGLILACVDARHQICSSQTQCPEVRLGKYCDVHCPGMYDIAYKSLWQADLLCMLPLVLFLFILCNAIVPNKGWSVRYVLV